MTTKICFRCNVEYPLSDFYTHKQMKDGHLNKCKACTKSDSVNRHWVKNKDSDWVEAERKRGREKYAKYRYKSKSKLNPDKRNIRNLTSHIRAPKGNEYHHWSYNSENAYNTFEISISDHRRLHNKIVYDVQHKCYRVKQTGELLDTKDKHKNFMIDVDVKIL